MPLNVMHAQYESFGLPDCAAHLQERHIGALGMKPIGAGILLESGKISPVECLRYAMSLPTSVVIFGCESTRDLQQALDLGRNFHLLSESERAALLNTTAEVGKIGEFEKY